MITTQAIVIPEPQRMELREVELLPPGPADLIVRTVYTSISAGTERMLLAGRMPHPMLSLPVVPGYETVGQVIGVGPEAPAELEGSWVYVGGARCFAQLNPAWGGQSAILHVDYRRAVPLGVMPMHQGVLLALTATALHGVDLLATTANQPLDLVGRRVLVVGQGPVGQLAARIARARGAWVAVADLVPFRLERAQADLVINAAERSVVEQLHEPVDTIIEASGSMNALAGVLPSLAADGTLLLLGYYETLQLPYMPLFLKQARVLTAREWAAGDPLRSRDLIISGAIEVETLLTHRLPVSEFVQAYDLAINAPECLKLVIEWE